MTAAAHSDSEAQACPASVQPQHSIRIPPVFRAVRSPFSKCSASKSTAMATNRVAAVAASSVPAHGLRNSVNLPETAWQASPQPAIGANWRRPLVGRCQCGSRILSKVESAVPQHKWPDEGLRPARGRRKEHLKEVAGLKRHMQFRLARSVKVLALGENGREDAQASPEPSDRWRQGLGLSNPSTSYDSGSDSPAESLEPAESDHFAEHGGTPDEEIGDYESDRRRQYRADVESGARGIASVLRAMGNSVSWGVSSTGRGLSAIQSGVQVSASNVAFCGAPSESAKRMQNRLSEGTVFYI